MSEYPSDWRIADLGDVINKITSGGTPKADNPLFYGGDIPFLKIDDITASSKYLTSHKNTITELGLQESSAKIVPPGTLLLTMYGTIGECCITTYPVATNQAIACFLDHPEIDVNYLYYCLRSKSREFSGASSQTTQANISATILKQTSIAVPPLPEQRKIAETLSGIDKIIEAKKKELQKSEFILEATKEDLMSNSADWHQCELGELLSFRNGLNTEKDNFGTGVPFVGYKDVYSGGVITAKYLSQKVSLSAVEEERFCLRTGDILFTRTSETPEEIGFSCVFDARDGGAVFNGFSIRGRPMSIESMIPAFSSFYFKSEPVLSQMRFLCKYTTRAGISAESLTKIKVRIPDLGTQQRIANSLISLRDLREKLDESILALQNLKASLSEDLLSGRKRLIV